MTMWWWLALALHAAPPQGRTLLQLPTETAGPTAKQLFWVHDAVGEELGAQGYGVQQSAGRTDAGVAPAGGAREAVQVHAVSLSGSAQVSLELIDLSSGAVVCSERARWGTGADGKTALKEAVQRLLSQARDLQWGAKVKFRPK